MSPTNPPEAGTVRPLSLQARRGSRRHRARTAGPRRAQRGVVLLFALIALLVLLIGAIALIRSFNTSLFMAGNIGFKRDLQNQGEQAVTLAIAKFSTTGGTNGSAGDLSSRTLRSADRPASNYSAQMLTSDKYGIPLVLVNSTQTDPTTSFTLPAVDVVSSTDATVTYRYVVDRLCTAGGDEKALGTANCAVASTPPTTASGSKQIAADGPAAAAGTPPAATLGVLYRLTVRVTGPRNTQSFFQSTFAVKS